MKRLLIVLAGLALCALAVVAVLIATFDANRYKPELTELGRRLTGRPFEIRGDLHLKPALSPILVADGLRLGNADWAQHATMLEVGRVEAGIRLTALLRHRVEITHVLLDGASLVLERAEDGVVNWAFTPTASGPGVPSATADTLRFALDRVSVREGRVELRDGTGSAAVLELQHLELMPDGPGQPLRLLAEATFNGQRVHAAARLAPLERLFANEPYALDLRLNARDARIEASGSLARPLALDGLDFTLEAQVPAAALLARSRAAEKITASARLSGDGDNLLLEDLELDFGQSAASATLRLELARERPRVTLDLSVDYIDAAELGLPDADPAVPEAQRVFTTAPLTLTALNRFDGSLTATVGRVSLPRTTLQTVHLAAALEDGELEVSRFSTHLDGGALEAKLRIDAADAPPRVSAHVAVEDISLTPLVSREVAAAVRGGHLVGALEFESRGHSPAELAAHADGHLLLTLRNAEIVNRPATVASSDLVLEAFAALNPLARSDDRAVIRCAVFNFPLADGRMQSATGIGITTRKLNILGGGTIDLASERLDLGIDPKPREGLGLNVAGLADFVRIGGTLSEPAATTDTAGAALAGAKVGAAIATGGISLLAEGLLDRTEGDVDVCAIARGELPPPAGAAERAGGALQQAAGSATQALKRAGSAVRESFGKLFGD